MTPPPRLTATSWPKSPWGRPPTNPSSSPPWSEEPVEEPDHADEHEDEPVQVAEASHWGDASSSEPVDAPAPVETLEPVEAPEQIVAAAEVPEETPVSESPIRLQIRRPLSAAPAATALEGDFVDDTEQSDDSTIFGELRSNWLSDEDEDREEAWTPSEADQGWNAAERAESADPDGTTRAGLPVRRPGGRLVPGGLSQDASQGRP